MADFRRHVKGNRVRLEVGTDERTSGGKTKRQTQIIEGRVEGLSTTPEGFELEEVREYTEIQTVQRFHSGDHASFNREVPKSEREELTVPFQRVEAARFADGEG
ncbi:hypothetical protein ACFQE8_15985 [Salinirubellus sp. GCM10025818]|uniref:hypothetical protein n=1 Tax=Salinirubellus TaxID=2162630 RepID=UPI0030CCC205